MKLYYREREKHAMSLLDTVRQKAKDFTAAVGELFNDEVRQKLETQLALAKQGIMFPVELPQTYDTLGTSGFAEPPIHFDVNSDPGRAIIQRFEEQLAEFNDKHPDVKAQAGFSNPVATL
ncbi:MAG TPA: hypothetical protein PKX38_01310 [Alphaproteobacteria bacterium]|nr:hypothetical protein [Micavibrio sp.]MBK9562735.1 hypothetical protein [Micavibrio sp.]HQX26555.1 hypothetical protein [Alphaproteobacteria bacterium]